MSFRHIVITLMSNVTRGSGCGGVRGEGGLWRLWWLNFVTRFFATSCEPFLLDIFKAARFSHKSFIGCGCIKFRMQLSSADVYYNCLPMYHSACMFFIRHNQVCLLFSLELLFVQSASLPSHTNYLPSHPRSYMSLVRLIF